MAGAPFTRSFIAGEWAIARKCDPLPPNLSAGTTVNTQGLSAAKYHDDMSAGTSSDRKGRTDRIRFTVLLPLLSIISWVCFIAVPVTVGALQLGDPHEGAHHAFLDHTAEKVPHVALWFNGVDLPANFVELPVDRLLPAWPDTWYPAGFTVFTWRAVTFPFYALPFWWFVGLGLDTLFGRRRLVWPVLLLGSMLCILCAAGAIALTQEGERPFDAPGVHLPIIVGAYLWAFLFAAFPTAWLVRRRG